MNETGKWGELGLGYDIHSTFLLEGCSVLWRLKVKNYISHTLLQLEFLMG
jgi:hypothetical protein